MASSFRLGFIAITSETAWVKLVNRWGSCIWVMLKTCVFTKPRSQGFKGFISYLKKATSTDFEQF